MAEGHREYAVRVPSELVDKFDRIYPAWGSKQWFFSHCMKAVVEMFERGEIESPESVLDRVVREADHGVEKRF